MSELIIHRRRVDGDKVEEREIDGRSYLVAPVVAVREGVLNGELLPLDELARYYNAWEDAPVPVHHPTAANGLHVSARTPDQVRRAPGRFYDVALDGAKLKGNVYLDIARAEALGGDAAEALGRLRAGEPMDVSTAYFRDLEPVAGEWNGQAYNGIQRNIVPDHLALLPGEMGACSWADGCGVPRTNSSDKGQPMTEQTRVIAGEARGPFLRANVEMSLDTQMQKVADGWYASFQPNEPDPGQTYFWVYEVWDNFAIVRGGGKWLRYPYTLADDGTVTFGEPEEVFQTWQTAVNANTNGGVTMTEEQKPQTNCGDCPEGKAPAAHSEGAQAPAAPAEAAIPPELTALLEVVGEYGGVDAFKEALLQFKANEAAERDALIAAVAANATAFDDADLRAMTTGQLRKLDASLRPANYAGRGLPVSNRAGSEWEPYKAPEVK